MADQADNQRRRPAAPGVAFQLGVLSLVVVLAAVSFSVRQQPPPTVAEFAPQAIAQIKQAPQNQTSQFGSTAGQGNGRGGRGKGGKAATPPASQPPPVDHHAVIDVPRVKQCIGDPPRQIEDPQSPPCVAYWQGNNGGATAKGVTGDEVRVAVPSDYDGSALGALTSMVAFFNERFQFYGRKIRVIDTHNDPCCTPDAQRAAADNADKVYHVFATLPRIEDGGYDYGLEAARRHLVSIGFASDYTSGQLGANAPYLWQYPMANDQLFANIGEWACARLVGGVASNAGPTFQHTPRRFGLITAGQDPDNPPDASPLKRQLATCGGSIAQQQDLTSNSSNQAILNTVVKMSQDHVTSVFCLCQNSIWQNVAQQSTLQNYFPEWLVSSYELNDYDTTVNKVEADQRAHAIGITIESRQILPYNEPMFWAVKSVNPQFDSQKLNESAEAMYFNNSMYRMLLLLASGIQMAGPNLTPQSFEQGLHQAAFPNPPHPNMPARVGFQGGSHSMTVDAAEYWVSTSAASPYTNTDQSPPGSLCYVDGGRRYGTGEWTRATKVYGGQCDSGFKP